MKSIVLLSVPFLLLSCLDLNSANYNFDGGSASSCVNRCTLAANPPVCVDGKTLLVKKVTGCDDTQCQYLNVSVSCTNSCNMGACVGEPCASVQCLAPAAVCKDGNTLLIPSGGMCDSSGKCQFQANALSCPCSNGQCTNDLCAGKSCSAPPPSVCNGPTLKQFASAGSCQNGNCSYSSFDVPCTFGCAAGACISGAGGGSATGGGTAASGGGTAASGGGTASIGGGTAATTGGGSAASGGGTAATGGGTAVSGGGTAATGGGTASTGGGTSSTGGGAALIPDWTARTFTTSKPQGRYGHCMAFDSMRNRVVLFGGQASGVVLQDTWTYDGISWRQESPSNVPAKRKDCAMAFDAFRGEVVMFGGYDNGSLRDTQKWNGTDWVPAMTPAALTIRSQVSMAYDVARQSILMYGGYANTALKDTWIWNGAMWSQPTLPLPVVDPSYAQAPGLAYDSTRNVVLFFEFNKTYDWNGMAWKNSDALSTPAPRNGVHMVNDSKRQRVVMFGGTLYSNNSLLNEVYEWNGFTWTLRSTVSAPPPAREGHAMAYDSLRGKVVVFGGSNPTLGNYLNDTWEFGP
jgi:hypothetical protein